MRQILATKRGKIIAIVGVLVLAGGLYMLAHRGEESTDDATIEAHVVTISPKVSGYVKNLLVVDNQHINAGDVLMEIDPADYIIRRDHARAALDAAVAAYDASGHTLETTEVSAPSNLDAAKAQASAAEANWIKADSDLKRMKRMNDEARSREQLEAAVAAEKTARSNWEDAKAHLRTAQTAPKTIATAKYNTDQLAGLIKQAQADLAQAEKDLADTKVIAPMTGRVTRKGIDQGDYVQPGEALGYLVGDDVWVVANFKETQLAHMQPGQKASIVVDAFPNVAIEGKVDSIQAGSGVRFSAFPPENATGNFVKIVQRVPVKILLTETPKTPLPLGPGMSVTPIVYTR